MGIAVDYARDPLATLLRARRTHGPGLIRLTTAPDVRRAEELGLGSGSGNA